MKDHIQTEIMKATPAVGGAAGYALTLNDWVGIATIGYVLLQAAYLVWKWRREARGK